MTTETRQRLLDALNSCLAIRRYTDGVDLAAYLRDDEERDAVERRLGIIGEALLIAAGQNLKRLLSRRGRGRRPFPSGAAGIALPPLPPTPTRIA